MWRMVRWLVLLTTLSATLGQHGSHRRSELNAALSSAFDRNDDGTVTFFEATFGIRSFADAALVFEGSDAEGRLQGVGNESFGIRSFADADAAANEPRNAGAWVFDATNRDCEHQSLAHTNDAAYVLDCTAEFARLQVRKKPGFSMVFYGVSVHTSTA